MRHIWKWLAALAVRHLSVTETAEVLRTNKKAAEVGRALAMSMGPVDLLAFLNDMSKTLRPAR